MVLPSFKILFRNLLPPGHNPVRLPSPMKGLEVHSPRQERKKGCVNYGVDFPTFSAFAVSSG